MTARRTSALILAVGTITLLVGCGSSGTGSAASSGPSSATAPQSSSGPSTVGSTQAPGTGDAIAGSSTPAASTPAASTPAAPPSSAPRTAPASFSGFVGTWLGHGRQIVITRSGTVTLFFRTYRNCTATVTSSCDRIVGNAVIDGGHVRGHVSEVDNATTLRVTVDSTTDPADFPLRPFTLGHDLGHDALAARVGGFTDAPFCGPGAPSGYCGA